MNKQRKGKNAWLLWGAALASIVVMFKSSENNVFSSLEGTVIGSFFGQFSTGNQIAFNLSVGVLVSLLIYVLVVWLPEKRKRDRIRRNLERQYDSFKAEVIRILLSAQRQSYASELAQQLKNKERFREYFKDEVSPGQCRWDVVFQNFDQRLLGELSIELDILVGELSFTLTSIDIEDEQIFSLLKNLQHVSHRIKGTSLEYDDRKSLFRFLWSIHTGFSFVTGYEEKDLIEETINSI